MPFVRPTLAQLVVQSEAEIAQRLGLAVLLPRSFLQVFARLVALIAHGLYGYAGQIAKQSIPTTATGDSLSQWAKTFAVDRRPAGYASGQVTVTGTIGSTVASGTRFRRSDKVEFTATSTVTLASPTAAVPVTASSAGAASNSPTSTPVTLMSPVSGIQNTASVTSPGITGGTDTETDEELRARLLLRMRNPPTGGSVADYILWARSVPGVTRAWAIEEHGGPGTVGVTFAVDAGDASPIPSGGKVAEVEAYIEPRRPAGSEVIVFAPGAGAVDVTIDNLSPDTAGVRLAVEQSLREMLARDGEPGGTILLSHIREAISLAAGENDYTLVAPVANVTVAAGEIPVLGTVTWA